MAERFRGYTFLAFNFADFGRGDSHHSMTVDDVKLLGNGDLFFSFRQVKGRGGPAQILGEDIYARAWRVYAPSQGSGGRLLVLAHLLGTDGGGSRSAGDLDPTTNMFRVKPTTHSYFWGREFFRLHQDSDSSGWGVVGRDRRVGRSISHSWGGGALGGICFRGNFF